MYLDKTIANCFHLSVLQKVFPNARYILLIRDPRANISSMIEGWPRVERFGKPQLTTRIRESPEATVDHWTYPAPPGWQEQLSRPLPEICSWSWKQHVSQAFDFVQDADTKSLTVRYEDLRDEPFSTIRTISDTFGLELTTKVEQFIQASPTSRTTVSEPEPEKWKRKNAEAIQSILPLVRETAHKIGYDI
jgi:hypothetical protein